MASCKRLLACGASAWVLAMASPLAAQTANTVQPEEQTTSADQNLNDIVVTARTVGERLQDVPITVSVLTAEDLRRQQIDDLTDIAEKTVGFAFEQFTGLLAQPTIRGQTNLRTTSPVQNVATYLNGIYLQRNYFIDQSLLDLERVEIIKGPQSALYGRNAFAGVINLNARGAELDEFSGSVSGTIGTDKRYDFRGSLNIPILPGRLGMFVSAGHSEFDGTWRNNHPLRNAKGPNVFTRGNVGGWDKQAVQVGVTFQPVESLTVRALYIYTDRELESVPAFTLSTAGLTYPFNSLNASPRALGPFPPAGPLQNRLFVGELPTTTTAGPGETRLPGLVVDPRTYGLRGPTNIFTGRVAFDPGGPFSLEYIYGHTDAKVRTLGSSARDPLFNLVLGPPFFPAPVAFGTVFDSSGTDSEFTSDQHELRVNFNAGERLSGFVGVNYTTTTDIDSNAAEAAPPGTLDPTDPRSRFDVAPGAPLPPFSVLFRRNTFLLRDEEVLSVFGYVKWSPIEQLTVTLEGRYTDEDQTGADLIAPEIATTFPPPPPTIAAVTPRIKRGFSFFTPRGTVTYDFTPDNNIYASVARGVKSGGINGVAANYRREVRTGSNPFCSTGTLVQSALITAGQALPPAAVIPPGGCQRFVQLTPGTAGLSPAQQFYEPETNWTYEIGSKNSFMGGRLNLNFSAYYTDWKNVQSNAVRLQPDATAPTAFAAIVPSLVGNVGDVEVYGAEIEGTFRLIDPLTVNFGASYNRARYKSGTFSQRFGASGNCDGAVCSFTTAPGISFPVLDIGGNQLERTPEFDALLGLTYNTDFANGWRFFARADATYQTKQFVDEANLAFVPDRLLVNASAGVTVGPVNVQVWAKNVFNKKYVSSSLFLIGIGGAGSSSYVPILGEQRTLGLTASASF